MVGSGHRESERDSQGCHRDIPREALFIQKLECNHPIHFSYFDHPPSNDPRPNFRCQQTNSKSTIMGIYHFKTYISPAHHDGQFGCSHL